VHIESLLQGVIAIMLADGVMEPREEKQLARMAAKHNIPAARVKELISLVQMDRELRLPQVDGWEKRNGFFKALVQMCLADGNVSSGERQVLRALVVHMGYADVDIDVMITKERAALYAASKETIKASKG